MSSISLIDAFKHNPMPFVLVMLLRLVGVLMIPVGFAFLRLKAPLMITGFVLLLIAVGCVGIGLWGYLSAAASVEAALSVAGLSAAEQEMMRSAGYTEATYALIAGLVAAALPSIGGVTWLFVALTSKPPPPARTV